MIGVGLERQGLAGATASIVDAQEVLPRNNTGDHVGKFQRDWLFATIRPQADRLNVLLGQCRAPAEKHPELAETVRGYAEHGLSLTAAGRALHIHANTVRYRLARWHELTGWDVHTWDGLSASMVGLNLFAQDNQST